MHQPTVWAPKDRALIASLVTENPEGKGKRIAKSDRVVSVFNAVGPPVPIPNTEVKRCSGENTWLATARKDNSMLTQKNTSDEEFEEVGYFNAVGPPVPIPNTEVKRCSGKNTWLATARKNSS